MAPPQAPALPPRNSARGFTLVETLVALAVLVLLLTLLTSIAAGLMRTWQRGEGNTERRANSRAIFELMSQDLRQAACAVDRSNTNSFQFLVLQNPDATGLAPGLDTSVELPSAVFFQAPAANDRSKGSFALMGYFVRWVAGSPTLCRLMVNPSSASYPSGASGWTGWLTTQLLTDNAPASAAQDYTGLLADNVLALWIVPFDPTGQAISGASGYAYDSRKGYLDGRGRTHPPNSLPASLHIAIVTVDRRTARRLTGSEKPGPGTTGDVQADALAFYNSLPVAIRQGAEVQTTTLPLPGGVP